MHHLRDLSAVIGTEPVEVYPGLHAMAATGTSESIGTLSHLLVRNTGGCTIWVSRSGTAGKAAPGSFPLASGGREEHHAPSIPLEPLSAVAEAEGGVLLVELRHTGRIFNLGA